LEFRPFLGCQSLLALGRVMSQRFLSSAPLTKAHGNTKAKAPSKIAPVSTAIEVIVNHSIWPEIVKTWEPFGDD